MEIKYIDRKTQKIKTETPPAEGLLKFLYDSPFGKTAILPIAKRAFISKIYGKQMDKKSSVKNIEPFVNKLNIDMSESEKMISEFISFNDFFYRKLKKEARPISNGFVSPGDGKIIAFENIQDLETFFVKGKEFTVLEFLKNKELANKYKSATIIILRLAPNDYHRFHFPTSGMASEITKIKGYYYSVSPYALCNNFVKVFCENKREYCTLSTEKYGNIIISPVGATMVGGITETYVSNSKITKGDEMGYFSFGGSTIVMLLDKNKIQVDKDIIENTKNKLETFVKMGEQIAI